MILLNSLDIPFFPYHVIFIRWNWTKPLPTKYLDSFCEFRAEKFSWQKTDKYRQLSVQSLPTYAVFAIFRYLRFFGSGILLQLRMH